MKSTLIKLKTYNRMTTKLRSCLLKPLNVAWGTTAVCLVASASVPIAAIAGQRPFTDFTSRQMAWCAVFDDQGIDCAASGYGGTACDMGFHFTFNELWADPKTGVTAGVD